MLDQIDAFGDAKLDTALAAILRSQGAVQTAGLRQGPRKRTALLGLLHASDTGSATAMAAVALAMLTTTVVLLHRDLSSGRIGRSEIVTGPVGTKTPASLGTTEVGYYRPTSAAGIVEGGARASTRVLTSVRDHGHPRVRSIGTASELDTLHPQAAAMRDAPAVAAVADVVRQTENHAVAAALAFETRSVDAAGLERASLIGSASVDLDAEPSATKPEIGAAADWKRARRDSIHAIRALRRQW